MRVCESQSRVHSLTSFSKDLVLLSRIFCKIAFFHNWRWNAKSDFFCERRHLHISGFDLLNLSLREFLFFIDISTSLLSILDVLLLLLLSFSLDYFWSWWAFFCLMLLHRVSIKENMLVVMFAVKDDCSRIVLDKLQFTLWLVKLQSLQRHEVALVKRTNDLRGIILSHSLWRWLIENWKVKFCVERLRKVICLNL